MRTRRLLVVTVPACLLTAWAAARDVGRVKTQNAQSVVATIAARAKQHVQFPAAGAYWVFGAGSREAMKAANLWQVAATHDSTGEAALVSRPDSRRAAGRENRSVLDLLFIIRVVTPGPYDLRLTPDGQDPTDVQLRITRFVDANAGAAMRAFGLAALFSLLLVVNAVLWFRGGATPP